MDEEEGRGREIIVDQHSVLGPEYQGLWTQTGINKIREWGDEAAILSSAHSDSSNFFNLLYKTVGTCNILSTTATGALSYLSVGRSCAAETPKLSILTVVSSIAIISSGINAFYVWNIRSMQHLIMSNEYATIAKDMQYQLSLPIHSREDMLLLFARTSAKMKEVAMRSPLIPPWIKRKAIDGRRWLCSCMPC